MIYATRIACGLRRAAQVEARLRLEAPLTLEATTRKGSVGLFNFPFFLPLPSVKRASTKCALFREAQLSAYSLMLTTVISQE